MNKRLTQIQIKKNDIEIAKPYYYELQPWDYVNGRKTSKSDKEKYRFRKDEIIKEGESLKFIAINIPERIEKDDIKFRFNFSTEKEDREGMLTIDDGGKVGLFENSIDINVICTTLQQGETGEIIRIDFPKIGDFVQIKIAGYENHSKEYIDRYVYPYELILWESD